MRTMYDSITPTDIPADADLVGGYHVDDPTFGWPADAWQRFPRARVVQIVTRAWIDGGQVLDVETGDATPDQAPAWVLMRRAAGLATPTVYCNLSTWPAVRAAFAAAGVAEPLYWIAHYTGTPEIPVGAIACQYVSEPGGAHYDLSAVADYWPGVDPAPTGSTFPQSSEEDMMRVAAGTNEHETIIVQGRTRLVAGCGYNDHVVIHQVDYWGSDPSGWNATAVGVGGHLDEFTLNADKPLDILIPPQAVTAEIRFTADHSFTIGAV